jgi:hypothetical protein
MAPRRRLAALARHVVGAGAQQHEPADTSPPPEGAATPAQRLDAAFAQRVAAVHAIDIFDMDAPCVRGFSQRQFDDDGYYAWEGLLTPHGNHLVKHACQRVQQLQDEHWLDADWEGLTEAEWASRGFARPVKFLDAQAKSAVRGGSQLGGAPAAERVAPAATPVDGRAVQNSPRLPVLDG